MPRTYKYLHFKKGKSKNKNIDTKRLKKLKTILTKLKKLTKNKKKGKNKTIKSKKAVDFAFK